MTLVEVYVVMYKSKDIIDFDSPNPIKTVQNMHYKTRKVLNFDYILSASCNEFNDQYTDLIMEGDKGVNEDGTAYNYITTIAYPYYKFIEDFVVVI